MFVVVDDVCEAVEEETPETRRKRQADAGGDAGGDVGGDAGAGGKFLFSYI